MLDYLRILGRRWWLVLAPSILIVALTLATLPPAAAPTYAVTMRFAAGLPPEPRTKDAYSYDRHYNWLASEYITRALAQSAETGKFAQSVTQRLGDPALIVPVGAIRSEYTASYLKLTVAWPEPAQAARIAQAVADELKTNGAAYWPQLSNADGEPVRLLDDIAATPIPPPLRSRFDLPVRALLGLLAGALLAFAWHYLDPVVRRPSDVEQTGLRVFGEVRT
jgi:capsular polysaccharide biosynthesis protein